MKLSVVMITYNHERFIAQALSSVLAQRTNFDFEIIVADDCSTDGTRAMVADFAGRYPGKILPLLRERNLGMVRNFREALAACRGEYLAILEGDDFWLRQDKLQSQVDFLDSHSDHAFCCARAQFVDQNGAAHTGVYPAIASGSYTFADLFESNWVATCTVMYRRASVGPLPDWFLTLKMADWPLHILVAQAGRICLMDEVVSAYRVHPTGAWSSLSPHGQQLAIKQMLAAVDKHLGYRHTSAIRPAIARICLDLAIAARHKGSRLETGRHLVSYARNRWYLPGQRRLEAGLAAYVLVGSWYKVFSKAKQTQPT
jgi:glycosyltransferase involved in cell wall biosynthesis